MALIKCAECGREVSDKATACPQCAAPIAPPLPVALHDVGIDEVRRAHQADWEERQVMRAAQKKPRHILKWALWGGGTFLGLSIVARACGTETTSPHRAVATTARPADEPQTAPAPESPPIEVSAQRLFADYDANEVSADSQYKGQTLMVTGKVTSIGKDFLDKVIVVFAGGGMFGGVHAYMMPSEKNVVSSLRKGQTLKVSCLGHGMIMKSPMLHDCRIEQISGG